MEFIPWIISGASALVALLTYMRNGTKDQAQVHEAVLKANIKLDQVCVTLNSIKEDTRLMQARITQVEKDMALVQQDIKSAFRQINELKDKVEE